MKRNKNIDATSLKASYELRVRFNETDPLGIVWHGNYIKYFEDGREAFGRKYNITYLDVNSYGYVTPIVKSECEHKLPLKYGEKAIVEVTYINTAAAKMIFQYEIKNEKGQVVCIGETTQVFVDMKGELSLNSPIFYEEWKKEHKIG
ncbi:acyl-CoA thioesterase [Tenacibaculum caenipelagi]|uniref:Acyl-CoA thioester hydrolase n=1 Tax=Tenacibaculum caenipelagi TaxID=1325435 RepID=A0A4R6TEY7_9FLAO|nr:acyl-CoA thioesterase [Tenacibaculum caenipelagi]TDQ28855.1 acyl-CoA thioester hydrolase [Tenacibaculum caenipelagi]